jgi:hypothetical protein
MLKVRNLESFPFQKAHHYAAYTRELCKIVRSLNLFIHLTECYDKGT